MEAPTGRRINAAALLDCNPGTEGPDTVSPVGDGSAACSGAIPPISTLPASTALAKAPARRVLFGASRPTSFLSVGILLIPRRVSFLTFGAVNENRRVPVTGMAVAKGHSRSSFFVHNSKNLFLTENKTTYAKPASRWQFHTAYLWRNRLLPGITCPEERPPSTDHDALRTRAVSKPAAGQE
jgi:hypothetical protein